MKEKRWTGGTALEAAVAGYFRSISRTVTAEERGAPILNDAGEPIRYREYVVPPAKRRSGGCGRGGLRSAELDHRRSVRPGDGDDRK